MATKKKATKKPTVKVKKKTAKRKPSFEQEFKNLCKATCEYDVTYSIVSNHSIEGEQDKPYISITAVGKDAKNLLNCVLGTFDTEEYIKSGYWHTLWRAKTPLGRDFVFDLLIYTNPGTSLVAVSGLDYKQAKLVQSNQIEIDIL